MDLEKGTWICVAGSSRSLQEEQREINEQDCAALNCAEQREINEQDCAALNCAEEYVTDSGGQETRVITEKVYGRNLYTDLEERKTGREKHA